MQNSQSWICNFCGNVNHADRKECNCESALRLRNWMSLIAEKENDANIIIDITVDSVMAALQVLHLNAGVSLVEVNFRATQLLRALRVRTNIDMQNRLNAQTQMVQIMGAYRTLSALRNSHPIAATPENGQYDLAKEYQILNLAPTSNLSEITEAYKNLLTVWNLERYGTDAELKKKAQDKTASIDAAYERIVLSLNTKRQQAEPPQQLLKEQSNGGSQASTMQPGVMVSAGKDTASITHHKAFSGSTKKVETGILEAKQTDVISHNIKKPVAQIVVNRKKAYRVPQRFSWKSMIAAFVIAILVVSIVNTVDGDSHSKKNNIVWTVMWIYLSIESWKYWGWKALLPYPMYLISVIMSGSILISIGDRPSPLIVAIVAGALNIGGLIVFYVLLRKSQTA